GVYLRAALHTADLPHGAGVPCGALRYASRALAAAHGGQIVCSAGSAALLRETVEPGVRVVNRGLYRLRESQGAEPLFSIEYPGMEIFPIAAAEAGRESRIPLQFT